MKKRLLIIDDDGSLKTLYKGMFYDGSIEVVVLRELSAGIELLKSKSAFDGIVLDVHFIQEKAKAVLTEIKSIRPNMALFLAGETSTKNILEYLKLSADEFIRKPFGDIEKIKSKEKKQ